MRLTACEQECNGPWLSPIICKTLVTYYHEVDEMIPEPVFDQETDLELHAPIGVYALCTVAVRKLFILGLM